MDGEALRPLGRHEKRIWEARFVLDDGAVTRIAAATKALAGLNGSSPLSASLGALADALMRSESVASSWIEGLEVSQT